MTALVRYYFSCVGHSQRYLPPVLLFAIVVVVGAHGTTSPMLSLYALWTGAMLISAVWLTVAVLGAEDPIQERITAVNAGKHSPLIAAVLVVLGFSAAMTMFGLLVPFILGLRLASPLDLVVGAVAPMAVACFGIAVGLFCGRPVISRTGHSLLSAALVTLMLLLSRGIPAVNPLIRLLSTDVRATAMLPQVLITGIAAMATLAASVLIVQAIRRAKT